jgi:NADH-quinone oxidoreductase subunit C
MSETTEQEPAGEPREVVHERHGVTEVAGADMPVLFPTRDQLLELVRKLHDDGYVLCLDVTAVDYLTYGRRGGTDGELLVRPRTVPGDRPAERFEVVYHLLSPGRPASRVRLRVQVAEDDATVPSVYDIHPGAEAAEREVFDMFGISFTGHPDLTRILMPEDWIGHPLRKDYSSGRIPVQFKDAPAAR